MALLAISPVQLLDLAGPLDIFAGVAEISGTSPYRLAILGDDRRNVVRSTSGLALPLTSSYRHFRGVIDTLIVLGGSGVWERPHDRALLDWLRRQSSKVRRLGAVCTGAFLLAEAGLLDGRKAVTHWRWCRQLAQMYPKVSVDPAPIYVQDQEIYTSAGVTAGMDLALAFVEEDQGSEIALTIARMLVLYLRRPGDQSQFSWALRQEEAALRADRRLLGLTHWIEENLHRPRLDISALAQRANLSSRHFGRIFRKTFGISPARYVESRRVENLRRRLEQSSSYLSKPSLKGLAQDCGFASVDVMRRVFSRYVGVGLTEYRQRFGPRAVPEAARRAAGRAGAAPGQAVD